MKPIVLLFAALTSALPLPAAVVINEIHANAEPNPVRAEFVELHNTGPSDIPMGGWRFSEGIDFLFPPGTILPAGGYLAIAESLPGFLDAFGRQSQPQVIAHWSFDETSGTTAADSTGRPNAAGEPKTAVATAGVTQDAEGRFGGSGIALDGAPGNYLTIPYLDELWSGSYTLAAWVRPADRGVNPILADHSNPQAFLFSVDTAAKMTHRGPAAMPATAAVWTGNGGTIVSNVWQHVAAVWDRDAQVGKIYLDGVLVFSTLVGKGPAELPLVQNARAWHIGRNQADTNTFKGGLDELWVVKGALPISSIRTLMNENRLVTTDVVDLADIVGGGDGSLPGSGARNGINPVTGAQVASYGSGDNIPTAPGAFQPVEHPMIDGVFVPDGTLVAGQTITTTGLSTIVRAGDNDPSPGFWYDGAGLLGDPTKVNSTSAHYLPRYLEDPFRHSILSGMTQKGITFDLDAIESSRNGRQVTGLTAVAADSRMQSGGSIAALVFLDGAEVYRQTNIAGGERIIDLPIPAQARFLTLVIANSDRNNASDHGFFADPFLHIDPLPASETGPPVMGPYAGSLSGSGEAIALRDSTGVLVDRVEYQTEFPWPVAAGGEGNSMELIHPSLDNQLGGHWRSSKASPTPGARNSVFSAAIPPAIRQVTHTPKTPLENQPMSVTARITDVQGVAGVQLRYQIVLPGRYISSELAHPTAQVIANPSIPRRINPAFEAETNWMTVAMLDNGTGGDAIAGDSIYTAVIAGQTNRTLIRYRILATDSEGTSVQVPYSDDPSLNFAAYVYNGVPDYVAINRSVTRTNGYVHPKEVLTSVPVYSLLTDATDLARCMAYDGGDQIPSDNFESREAFNWNGTFVYNGEVYDHIHYRLRQRNDRYGGAGKRSFRFRFNRGNYAQFHDFDGRPYSEKWRTLNTHKMSARGGPNLGLHEMANSELWRIFGVPSPSTHWFHFRVVDAPVEAPTGVNGQHLGDFFGMMLALEDYDSRFLSSRSMPEGNLYKLNSYILNGKEVQRYQAPGSVSDGSDFYNILWNLRPERTDLWLNTHVDWPAYYRYHTVVDAVRHYDVAPNTGEHLKNRSWYFRPDPATPLGKLMTLPWDSDTSWGPNWNGGEDFSKAAVLTPNKAAYVREYKNVVREFRDLIWQRDQIEPLLDRFQVRMAAFQLADRDRWTGAPPAAGSQADQPFAEKVADMKKFAFIGGSWDGGNDPSEAQSADSGLSGQQGRDAYLDWLQSDIAIPETPVITYTGLPGFPANGLVFESSEFKDPQGAGTFQAMEWRIAEYLPNVIQPDNETLIGEKSTWKYHDLGVDLGTSWRAAAYDDTDWGMGRGEFGYGEAGLGTTNSFGPNPANRHLTYYFRKKFQITEPERFTGFLLGVKRDDGAVVYLNGEEVFRTGMPAAPAVISFNTRASADQTGANETRFFTTPLPLSALPAGEHTFAVEIHQFNTNNTDLRFDLTLSGIYPIPTPPTELRWEYEHRWKSATLSNFVATVAIPTSAVRENRHYRARVRHMDNTGRWSHWSAPVAFQSTPVSIQPLLDHLAISEIMYDPSTETPSEGLAGWRAQDFEYVELENRSSSLTLDLTDVRFTQGIEVAIDPGVRLAPGARCLVARSRAALTLRHGAGLPIVGEFSTSRLDNGGEPLKLSYGGGTPIREFRYDDDVPWPAGASGTGSSITFIPTTPMALQSDGSYWRNTPASPGAPSVFPQGWAAWLANYFKPNDPTYAQKIPATADPDGDGLDNATEYVLGSNPAVAASRGGIVGGTLSSGGEFYFTLSYLFRSDASVQPESSTDLTTWVPANLVEVSRTPQPDGSLQLLLREAQPMRSADKARFLRIRAGRL